MNKNTLLIIVHTILKINNSNKLIEINPTYTHNSTIGPIISNKRLPGKDKNYHLSKSNLAKENGYFCIHVWDNDNWDKIINLLIPKQKIYARRCEIKNISKFELLRLCSHKDYKIIGGSEKLFKHFIRELNPKSIISYCDNSKFSGDVYKRLGMKLNGLSEPVGNWYKGNQIILDSLLRQRGFDQLFGTNYGKGTSNINLMIQNNWVQVFNCRQKVIQLFYNGKLI